MLAALLILPIVAVISLEADGTSLADVISRTEDFRPVVLESGELVEQYIPFFPKENAAIKIISGLAWGLGYCGMPHILVRFMAIEKASMIKKSRNIAIVWVTLALGAAVVVGFVGRAYFNANPLLDGTTENVFINMVRELMPPFVSGILLSAVLAASMSTADSQLLVASSAFTSDVYKPIFRKDAGEKEILWVGRLVVIVVSLAGLLIAANPNSGNIMSLVSNAWAGFGAAFGPTIILSLYWKRFTYKGAIAGIVTGGLTVVLWIAFLSGPTGLYELFPGFVLGFIACIVGSLASQKPTEDVTAIFETATAKEEE